MSFIKHITELTRTEFNQKLRESAYGWEGEEVCCPSDTAECSELICPKEYDDEVTSCIECWNKAIKHLHFVGDDEGDINAD